MKATLWLCSIVTTMLCTTTQSIYASPITQYQYSHSKGHHQDNSYLVSPKRTKPSLSIVNPLDVLRQRLLLEIARRQMRENTKQVEINRAILKNVGKRGSGNSLSEEDYFEFEPETPSEWMDVVNQAPGMQFPPQFQQSHQSTSSSRTPNINYLLRHLLINSEFPHHPPMIQPKIQQMPHQQQLLLQQATPDDTEDSNGDNEQESNRQPTESSSNDEEDEYRLNYLYSLHKDHSMDN